jgi:inosine/xanthosine triphosphate pyrophosphatase family protein
MTLSLVAGTTNAAKAAKLRELCAGLDVAFVEAGAPPAESAVDETGASHLANAVSKARAWSQARSVVAIASDGGLVIPALGDGWESLLTRRATGGEVSDEEHARRLLGRMRELTGERRAAHWAEAIAIARGGSVLGAWEDSGLCGRIADSYEAGPGAVPGFWVSGLWQTEDGRRHWELEASERAVQSDPWEKLAKPVRAMLARLC